ncbi:MAG TPA: DUF6600 domain-containing protein [Thermoanaerobaculia bacterium]
MKTLRISVLTLLFLLGAAAGEGFALPTSVGVSLNPSTGQTSINLGFFYDDLAPYGNWVDTPRYGWAWTPSNVADTWQPYEDGRWTWTDQGWTWLSDEPFGWATYHYGRWYDDSSLGWAWVPGNEWAPSWVSFQEGPDYIGWAPLPPSVRVVSGFNRVALAPRDFVFVPQNRFLATDLADFILPAPRAVAVFPTTRNVTVFRMAGDRVFVPGVQVARFGRVPRFRIADLGADLRLRAPRIAGDRIGFFRPRVNRALFVPPPTLRRAARASVVKFADFPRVRRARLARQVPPPWAPAWGRRGLAPGQLKHAQRTITPATRALRLRDRDVRGRVVRGVQPSRGRVVARQSLRPADRLRHVRAAPVLKHGRPEVRSHQLRQAPSRQLHQTSRMKRVRPQTSVRHRPERSVRHVRPSRSVQHARPAMRQHQARPARQQRGRPPGRHRP